MATIVIKPNLGANPAKGPGLRLHGLTRVNPQKLIFFLRFNILYEKFKKQSMWI
jgi:hypothetical protein